MKVGDATRLEWAKSMINDVVNVPRDPFKAIQLIKGYFPDNKYELRRESEVMDYGMGHRQAQMFGPDILKQNGVVKRF